MKFTLYLWIVMLAGISGIIGWNIAQDPGFIHGVLLGLIAAMALQQIGIEFRNASKEEDE